MLEIMKKELNVSIIASIIYIILGFVIISNPQTALNIVSYTISISAIIYGIVITVINIANLKEEGNLLFGILLVVMGIALLIYPNSLNVLISLGIGIWFIASSVSRIKFATLLKDVQGINWIIILISAVITLMIGISFIFSPLASAVTLTTISGILMIAYSICDIFEIIFIKRNISDIEKALKK